MAAWAANQLTSGHDAGMLPEQIHNSDPDQPEGRRMGDGSSAFVIEILELLRGANDTTTLQLCVPHPSSGSHARSVDQQVLLV